MSAGLNPRAARPSEVEFSNPQCESGPLTLILTEPSVRGPPSVAKDPAQSAVLVSLNCCQDSGAPHMRPGQQHPPTLSIGGWGAGGCLGARVQHCDSGITCCPRHALDEKIGDN